MESAAGWVGGGSAGFISNGVAGLTQFNPPAPQGVQVAYLGENGSLSQTITISKTGTYEIQFKTAQRKRTAVTNGPIDQRTFNVAIDGVAQFTAFKPVRTDYTEPLKTLGKQLTPGKHTIRFFAMAGGLTTDIVLIDDVRLVRIGTNKVESEESRVESEEESRIEVASATDAVNAPLVMQKSQLYYRFGGKQMAVKLSNSGGMTTTWLHGDHLGSASMATDGSGTVINEGPFKPFGEPLGSPITKPTSVSDSIQ